jgi:phage shock protein A
MSIFSRIFKVGQASINKLVDSFEKPEVMLEQAIRDKEQQVREAKQSIQKCIATEHKTRALLDAEKKQKSEWEARAESALQSGKEELAVKALQRATEHETKALSYEQEWQVQREGVEELKKDIYKLEDELSEVKRNKDFIISQAKASDVKKQIYEAKAKISKGNSSDDLLARMKEKAERSKYEANAAKEMAEMSENSDSLEKEFEDLGASSASSDVQAKLAAMKAKMGQGGASSAPSTAN